MRWMMWRRGNICQILPHSTSMSAGQDIAGAVASEMAGSPPLHAFGGGAGGLHLKLPPLQEGH